MALYFDIKKRVTQWSKFSFLFLLVLSLIGLNGCASKRLVTFVNPMSPLSRSSISVKDDFPVDIWLADTRTAPWTGHDENDMKKSRFFRFEHKDWKRSDSQEFIRSHNHHVPLIIFILGYTATVEDNIKVAEELLRKANGHYCRILIWNWPSESVYCGLRRDIRSKIPIAETNGKYLAAFLQEIHRESRVYG